MTKIMNNIIFTKKTFVSFHLYNNFFSIFELNWPESNVYTQVLDELGGTKSSTAFPGTDRCFRAFFS